MVVMDAFALPVEGTETRVNAQAQGYEYMTEYIEAAKKVGRLENAVGWYHSHPGYGCWLSGIDVSTQMLNQNFQVRTGVQDHLDVPNRFFSRSRTFCPCFSPPFFLGSFRSHSRGPGANHLGRKGEPGGLQNLPKGE